MMSVLAVDLGGTNTRAATVTENGDILKIAHRSTPENLTLDQLTATLQEMAAECGEFTAVGVGVPANVGPDGVLRRLPNIPSLEGAKLHASLRSAFGMPVVVENDATAACIGEAWLGASKDVDSSILVTLGTGVGGGIIVAGEALRGPDGAAAKIGHICVEPDGHPCGCGSRGCVEQYASATAIVRMANEEGLSSNEASEVFEAFVNSDPGAARVFGKMGRYLGIMLGGLVNTFNPEMLVIGGGVADAWEAFAGTVQDEIEYRAFAEPAARARLVRSELGGNAGVLGAARSAFLKIACGRGET